MFPTRLCPKLFTLFIIVVPGPGISSAFFGGKQLKKALEELICVLKQKTQHEYERKCYSEFVSVRRTMLIWFTNFTLHFNYWVILGRLKDTNVSVVSSVNIKESKKREVGCLLIFFLSCCSFSADAFFLFYTFGKVYFYFLLSKVTSLSDIWDAAAQYMVFNVRNQ